MRECCNYVGGNCIALDDGEECICVQSISYSLLCKWFQAAVLPLDKGLETALLFREEMKRCAVCSQPFLPGSNRASIAPSALPKLTGSRKPPATVEGEPAATVPRKKGTTMDY